MGEVVVQHAAGEEALSGDEWDEDKPHGSVKIDEMAILLLFKFVTDQGIEGGSYKMGMLLQGMEHHSWEHLVVRNSSRRVIEIDLRKLSMQSTNVKKLGNLKTWQLPESIFHQLPFLYELDLSENHDLIGASPQS